MIARRTTVSAASLAVALACGCGNDDSASSADDGGSGGATGGSGGSSTGGTAGTGASGAAGSSSGGQGQGGTGSPSGGTAGTGGIDNDPGLGGPARCDGSDLLACDSFESGIDPTLWEQLALNGGVLAVDNTRAARGSNSLKATITGEGASQAQIMHDGTLPTSTNNFSVRVFVYTEGPFPEAHFDLLQARGDEELPWVALAMGDDMASGKFEPLYHGTEIADDALFPEFPPMLPANRWVCLEWELRGATNEIVTYMDGEELTQLTVPTSQDWPAPTYTSITIGLFNYHEESTSEFTFWFDDIAIDDSRIGCGR